MHQTRQTSYVQGCSLICLSLCNWACNEARSPKTMIDRGQLVWSQFQLLGFHLLNALEHMGPITYVKQYLRDVGDQVPALL